MEKHDVASRFSVAIRDLRAVDPSFRNLPTITVRDQAIIVNLEASRTSESARPIIHPTSTFVLACI